MTPKTYRELLTKLSTLEEDQLDLPILAVEEDGHAPQTLTFGFLPCGEVEYYPTLFFGSIKD